MKALKLNPWFEDYMSEAMKPLGVYLNFFQPTLAAGKSRTYRVMMVNDLYGTEKGTLRLTFEAEDGREVARVEVPFEVAPLGTLSARPRPRGAGDARALPAEGDGDHRRRRAHGQPAQGDDRPAVGRLARRRGCAFLRPKAAAGPGDDETDDDAILETGAPGFWRVPGRTDSTVDARRARGENRAHVR